MNATTIKSFEKKLQKMQKSKKASAYEKSLRTAAEQILSGSFDIRKYYGISDDGLEAIYAVGSEMFKHKQFEKARDTFSLLSTLAPENSKYLSACGSASFMLKDYHSAVYFFRLAAINGDYSPKILLRLAECSSCLNLAKETKKYLQEALSLSKKPSFVKTPEDEILLARAKMMLSRLEKSSPDAEKNPPKEAGKPQSNNLQIP
jgi:predicted Zn-dependent protease